MNVADTERNGGKVFQGNAELKEIARENKSGMIPRGDAEIAGSWAHNPELVSMGLELRTYAQNAAMNLLQMGRVLEEAKGRVEHGEWTEFVRVNAKMSVRTAQTYMQAWREFGMNPRIAELGSSQVVRLLPMTDEERGKLLQENDVGNMSVREMDAAIRRIRQEERERAEDAARKATEERERAEGAARKAIEEAQRIAAEEMAEADAALEKANDEIRKRDAEIERLNNLPPEVVRETVVPEEMTRELERMKAELERMAEMNRELMEGSRDWMREKAQIEEQSKRMRRELEESEETIREQQTAMNQIQDELLSLKSAQARGEGAQYRGDGLTLDVFERAVREFIGICASMPFMRETFAGMDNRELNQFFSLLKTVESWADGTRQAMESLAGGVVIA